MELTLYEDGRHPLSKPAQWVATYSHRQYRMRGLFDRAARHFEAEGREEEDRGRPMREVRLMVLPYRPRPERLRPEESLDEENVGGYRAPSPCKAGGESL